MAEGSRPEVRLWQRRSTETMGRATGRVRHLRRAFARVRSAWEDERVFVALLCALAVLLHTQKLVRFWKAQPGFIDDFEDGDIARNLLSGRGYVSGEGWLTPPYQPTAHKPPAYVLLLLGIYKVFDGSQVPVTVANAGFLVAVYVLTYLCFSRWTEPASAKAGALFLMASPLLLDRAVSALNVPLAALLVLVFLATAGSERLVSTPRRAIAAGVAGGSLLLTMPSAFGFVVATYYRMWRPRSGFPWEGAPITERRRVTALAAAACVAVLTPWTVRNAVVFREFVPLTSQPLLEYAIGNGPSSTGGLFRPDGTPVQEPSPEAVEEARARGLDEVAAYRYYGLRALEWSAKNPGRWVELRLLSAAYFFVPQNLFYSIYRSLPTYPLTLVYTLLLICLAATGWWRARKEFPLTRLASSAVFWTAAVYALTHANVDSKYREPIDPLLAGFAGVALVRTFRLVVARLKERRTTTTSRETS